MKTELENALKAGSRIAEFRILEVLGAGGFGITYKAYDEHLDDYVAIKEFFPAEYAVRRDDKATVKARSNKDWDYFQYGLDAFRKEAKTLARFATHPNIVTVRRYLEAHETAYLVMQYEEGETLAQWFRRHPQPREKDLREIFMPVLDGLREVHNQHYLHRDIKPDNIYIRSDGRPLLIDFGSARQALGDRSQSLSIILSEGYAAKEQYSRNGKQGAWTDLYGIGATLWRAVSGQKPPSAPDRNEAQDEGQPDPLRPAIEIGKGRYSENLLQAIDWALAYLPPERPQTVWEFQQRLLNPTGSTTKAGHAEPASKKAGNVDGVLPTQSATYLPHGQLPKRKGRRRTVMWFFVAAVPLAIAGIVVYQSSPLTSPAKPIAALTPTTPTTPSPSTSLPPVTPAPAVKSKAPSPRQSYEPELVRIQAGCFSMGSPANEPERDDDERQHQVCIQSDYEIGKHEVTQGEWEAVMGSNPSQFKEGDRYPVENVSWNDIQDYLTKLNQKTGKAYRLPTEAEWEYAARAGTTPPFWTGRCVTTAQANYDGNYGYGEPDCGAKTGVYRQKTQGVGSYPANPWGLYDTMGNVWEWTCSLYDKDYGGSEQKCSNNDTDGHRAVRGGSWSFEPARVRSANRYWVGPAYRYNNQGFRLARSL